MQGRLAFRIGASVLSLALFACSTDDPTSPEDPEDPGLPPVGSTVPWSQTSSWPSGQVPGSGEAVVIPAGKAVLLDVSPPPLSSLRIEGTLVFDERDLDLTAGHVLVLGGLRVGTSTAPFQHRATITLTGALSDGDVMGMGNRVLGAVSGGIIDLHGETRRGWTRLSSSAAAGSTQLMLLDAVDWRPGDKLVVASTDFEPTHAEVVTVSAVSGSAVTLAQPLGFSHYGELQTIAGRTVDERAEVGLLTRNVMVRGDSASSQLAGYGGHVMGTSGSTLRVSGVTLRFMGQKGLVARYPMHWHMMGPVDGQYFTGSSVWGSFNRCVTVHGTDNARVEGNVCHSHLGHGYFLEDGAETGNVLAGNLGLGTQATDQGVLPTDGRAATFWITNPDNTVRGNVAAGSTAFGFWYALPASPTGLSTGQPDLPRNTALREFSDNVAHTNRRGGLHVDDGPRPDGQTETVFYAPRTDPGNASTAAVADFTRFLAYKHPGRAVWLRGRDHRLSHSVLADNAIGATFASSETFVEDALFVGESANNAGTVFGGAPRRGYEFYDGRVGAERVTFANYTAAASIPSSALGFLRNNGFAVSTGNFAGDVTFVNANRYYLETPHDDKDGDKAAVFLDRDGDVTGTAGTFVVPNHPFLVTPACTSRPEWNAYVCPERYLGFNLRSDAEVVAPLTLMRDGGAALTLVGVPDHPESAHASLLPGHSYTVQFAGAAPLRPRITLSRSVEGEGARITLPYPQAALRVIRDFNTSSPLPAAADLAELDSSTGDRYWYDGGAGMLHLKLVTRTGRTSATIQVEPQ